MLSKYLPNCGWKPIVVCVHEKYNKEELDYGLCQLVPNSLQVIKKRLNIKGSLYSILQIMSLTLFETLRIEQLHIRCDQYMNTGKLDNQLNLFD